MTKLTDKTIRSAKPRNKRYKLFDGQGLYLLVNPNGSKYWRMKYRFQGKEKLLSLGVFDPSKSNSISLSEARKSLKSLRQWLRWGWRQAT